MIITVASYKGGVGKTTTAVHLAAYFQTYAPTLLLDGDENRQAVAWEQEGQGFPFKVADEVQAARLARNYEHIVIDTGQKPTQTDFRALAEGCDLLVVPAVPATLDTKGLVLTIQTLQQIASAKYRVLLTKVAPPPETEAAQLRAELVKNDVPIFTAEIPRLKALEKAVAAGVTVDAINEPRARRAWEAYQLVGKEIMNGRA